MLDVSCKISDAWRTSIFVICFEVFFRNFSVEDGEENMRVMRDCWVVRKLQFQDRFLINHLKKQIVDNEDFNGFVELRTIQELVTLRAPLVSLKVPSGLFKNASQISLII